MEIKRTKPEKLRIDEIDLSPFEYPLTTHHLGRFKFLLDLQFDKQLCCDHTFNKTKNTLDYTNTPAKTQSQIFKYLRENGEYCDCEVMMNITEAVFPINIEFLP